jgi:hypothetical protein
MSKKIEAFEYVAKSSGKTYKAYSLADLLELAGIEAPAGCHAIKDGNDDNGRLQYTIIIMEQTAPQKRMVKEARRAGVMAKPLSTKAPQAPANGLEERFNRLETALAALLTQTSQAPEKAAPVGTTITRKRRAA